MVLSELKAFIKRVGRERLLFLRPLPKCIRGGCVLSSVSAPESCNDCREFLVVEHGSMKACIFALGVGKFDRFSLKSDCRKCDQWSTGLCNPCYFSQGGNFLEV